MGPQQNPYPSHGEAALMAGKGIIWEAEGKTTYNTISNRNKKKDIIYKQKKNRPQSVL
jgi:hypothetical protein